MLEEFIAYRTEDGRIFSNLEEALNHEKSLEFNERLERLVEDSPYVLSRDVEDVIHFVQNSGELLYELLKLKYGEEGE